MAGFVSLFRCASHKRNAPALKVASCVPRLSNRLPTGAHSTGFARSTASSFPAGCQRLHTHVLRYLRRANRRVVTGARELRLETRSRVQGMTVCFEDEMASQVSGSRRNKVRECAEALARLRRELDGIHTQEAMTDLRRLGVKLEQLIEGRNALFREVAGNDY